MQGAGYLAKSVPLVCYVDDSIRISPVSTGSFGAYLTSVFGRPGAGYRGSHFVRAVAEDAMEGKLTAASAEPQVKGRLRHRLEKAAG